MTDRDPILDSDGALDPEGDLDPGTRLGPRLPRWRRSQPLGLWWVMPVGLSIGLWVLLRGQVRTGGYVMAGTLALGALLRLVLPRSAVGGLFVRSRLWDVVTLLALALGMVVLSATLVIR